MKKQENKKIIGYKLIKQEYEKAAIAIVNSSVGLWNDKINFSDNDTWYNEFKNAGVLDIWFTPVYKEEPKFEVGKWYKITAFSNNVVYFIKYLKSENEAIFVSDFITCFGNFGLFGQFTNVNILKSECVLQEIQQYLPDGHPDKIVKEFVLAPNWWIAVTEENKDVLSKWRGSTTLSVGELCGMCKWNTGEILKGHNPINRTNSSGYSFGNEITFEQFKKYVLKEVDWTKATKEELLAEAKRRYPLLSVIKGLCGETFTLRGYELQYSNHTRILKASDRDAQYLYKDNKWAEIIEQPKKAPYTPGMRTPDIGPYYGKTELFSKEQLEVINKMIDDKVKELQ